MEFNSFGPAVGRLGSDSSRGAKLRQSRSRGAEPPLTPLTLTTGYTDPQNGDRIVATDSVTSLHLVYTTFTTGRPLPLNNIPLFVTESNRSLFLSRRSDRSFNSYQTCRFSVYTTVVANRYQSSNIARRDVVIFSRFCYCVLCRSQRV